jgi:hypothetical protein
LPIKKPFIAVEIEIHQEVIATQDRRWNQGQSPKKNARKVYSESGFSTQDETLSVSGE